MRTTVLLVAVLVVAMFSVAVLYVVQRETAFSDLVTAEKSFQKSRAERAKRAAAEKTRKETPPVPQPPSMKRTMIGEGSVEVAADVSNFGLRGFGTDIALGWPDHFHLNYYYGPKSRLLRNPHRETLSDGSVLEWVQETANGKPVAYFHVGNASLSLANADETSVARALATLRTYRKGHCDGCEHAQVYQLMTEDPRKYDPPKRPENLPPDKK